MGGLLLYNQVNARSEQYPLVISTWPFVEAVRASWRAVENGLSAVDSVVEGCSACEDLRCDGTGESLVHMYLYILYLSDVSASGHESRHEIYDL